MRNMMLALALFGLMFAAGANVTSDVRQSILEMRYAQLECRAEFLYSAMDSAEARGNASLEGERANVQAAMAQLNSYVEAGDASLFNHYMDEIRTSFADGARSAMSGARGALGGMQGEERRALIKEMRSEYGAAREQYVSCKHAAVVGRIRAELDELSGWHARGEEVADGMEGRGYNASRMRETLAEAEETADELGAGVDENGSTDGLLQMRSEKWGHEFYLWAQFHKERINLLLDRFEEKTDGYEAEVAEIRATLDEAASVGDDEIYTLEEAQESKALVNQAMQQFSALVEEARGSE